MLRRNLHIFVGSIVFLCIFFPPLSLYTPAHTSFFDLQLPPQLALPTQPVFVQQNALPETAALPQPESSPQKPPQARSNPGALSQGATASTNALEAAALPRKTPEEKDQLPLGGSNGENNFLPETPAVFYRLDGVQDKVALTFDDGPCPKMTEQYLAVLQAHGLQATFFVVGRQAVLYPEILEKIIAQGSELGSHSWQHDRLDKLTAKQTAADLQKTAAQIYEAGGQEIAFFRPPYGRGTADVLAAAKELGQKLVYWDVDPRDWEEPPPEKIVSKVMEQVRPGSIIILHEGYQNTLTALPEIIQGLQARNLQPVSVSALLAAWGESVATAAAEGNGQ